MRIAFVLGTRPEIIKLSPLIRECLVRKIKFSLIHTNQHYDENLNEVFFRELRLPSVNYNLGIGSGSHNQMIGKMLQKLENVLLKEKPDIVLVEGDTNSVLAGGLAAVKLGIKVGHVEAGLRSYDKTMPEEINRTLVDHLSDFLFCPTELQKGILIKEGIENDKIFVVGNTIVDAVNMNLAVAKERSIILKESGLNDGDYFLMTCHRPSNVDDDTNFQNIIEGVTAICSEEKIKCVFPAHPRLKCKLDYLNKFPELFVINPVGYLDLLALQNFARLIFTDSGGIQEEACILGKKCVILRLNTDRPETLKVGGALLLSEISKEEIQRKYWQLAAKKIKWFNPFGDGRSSDMILNILLKDIKTCE